MAKKKQKAAKAANGPKKKSKKRKNPSFNTKAALKVLTHGLAGVGSGLVEVGLTKFGPPQLNNPFDLTPRAVASGLIQAGAAAVLGGMGFPGPGTAVAGAGLARATERAAVELSVPEEEKEGRKAQAEAWLKLAQNPPENNKPAEETNPAPAAVTRPMAFARPVVVERKDEEQVPFAC